MDPNTEPSSTIGRCGLVRGRKFIIVMYLQDGPHQHQYTSTHVKQLNRKTNINAQYPPQHLWKFTSEEGT